MYVIRLTEVIFRFETELRAKLGHYYLWVLETSLPPPRAEVRSLRLAITTEFSSGKGNIVINLNPEKLNARWPEIAKEPDRSLEEKPHRLEKEQSKMSLWEVWDEKGRVLKSCQGNSIQKVGKTGQIMDSDICGKENKSSFKQIYQPAHLRSGGNSLSIPEIPKTFFFFTFLTLLWCSRETPGWLVK